MPAKQRKIEVHRLTISGLPDGTAYGAFLRNLRGRTRPVAEMVMKAGEHKCIAVKSVDDRGIESLKVMEVEG